MSVDNKVVASNIFWRYAERVFAQGMTFIVSLVLARLLDPDEYGTIAIVSVIIAIFEVFVSRGFVQALIQKKDIDHLDYSTVFYTNIVIELFLYGGLFLFSPFIASFCDNESLSPIIKVLGLRLLISGFNSVQQAYVQRNMQFKKFFFSTSIGTVLSGVVGVTMAYKGYGVWALVTQSLINPAVDTIVLFFSIEWKPRIEYSVVKLKEMWSYGAKMLGSGLLESVYNEIRSFVIGKVYSSSDLAFYNRGQNLPSLAVNNIQVSIGNVFFSALSREATYEETKDKMRKYLQVVFYVMSPILIGLAVVSEPLLVVLYTEKWLPSKPYMIIYSLSYLTWVPQMTWLQGINSRGRAGISLKLLIVHRIIGISLIFLLLGHGPLYIAISALIADCIITLLIYFAVRKMFSYNILELISDIWKVCIETIIMAALSILVQIVFENCFLKLVFSVLTGVLSYIVLSAIFKPEGYIVIIQSILNKIKRKNT